MRRSTPLALAAVLALAACSGTDDAPQPDTAPTGVPASPSPTEDAPAGPGDVHDMLGCTDALDDGWTPPEYPDVTQHDCASGATLVIFDSPGAGTLYVDGIADAITDQGYQHVTAETWSVWGTNQDVLAAAIDAGGTLHQ